jgi:hypothetical protein
MSIVKRRPTKKQMHRHFGERLPERFYSRRTPDRNGNGSRYDPVAEDTKRGYRQ